MLEYVPSYDLKIATEDIDSDRFTSKLLDRLKLGRAISVAVGPGT